MCAFTAVGVDEFGVDEAHFQVVQHSRFVQITQCCQVIFSHQDVWIAQVRQVLGFRVQLVLQILENTPKKNTILTPPSSSNHLMKKPID